MSFLVAAVMLLSLAPHSIAAPWQDDSGIDGTRMEKSVLFRGFDRPLELEVLPDGRVLVIELGGKLWMYHPESATCTLALELDIFLEQENGLIGLALDPDFASNGWIWLQYSPPDFSGQHVSRFKLNGDVVDPLSEQIVFTFLEQRRECCHHAGSLEFGPDGCLFIATGDNTHPGGDSRGYAPRDERADRFPFDAQRSSANNAVYGGKVLRIKPTEAGGYLIPSGNLFPADGSAGRSEIYVMGCRNPWRISVDRKTGFLYWGEVGPDAWNDGPAGPRGYDEINQARKAGNFGWPLFIANNLPYHDHDFETDENGALFDPLKPRNTSPNNTGAEFLPPAQPAWIYYPYGKSTDFPELNAAGGRSACAGPVYHFDAELQSDTKFPQALDGALFIFEWTRHWVKAVHMNAAGDLERIEALPGDLRFRRPVDIVFGPEGAMYMLEYGTTWGANEDSALVRIDYRAGNRAPHAHAVAQGNIGAAPLAVKLDSAQSSDKDGDELTRSWRVLPDGKPFASAAQVQHVFAEEGIYTVELTVTDAAGSSSTARVPVMVGNTRPTVRFVEPREGGFFDWEEPVIYRLAVDDAEDGSSLEDDDRTWWSENVFAEAAFHTGAMLGAAEGAGGADAPGLAAFKRSDCLNCHALDRKVFGPGLLEIADRYRGDDAALDVALERVRKGSTGVWGDMAMRPHAELAPQELRLILTWIFALEDGSEAGALQAGLTGELLPPVTGEDSTPSGIFTIDAKYNDVGGGPVGPLLGEAHLHLRTRRVQAEHADALQGVPLVKLVSADQGACIGGNRALSQVRFSRVDLFGIESLRIRAGCTDGADGTLELRAGGPEGELLASMDITSSSISFEPPSAEASIALRASNGRLVCADGGNDPKVLANRDAIGSWELFDLVPMEPGSYVLRAHTGKFVGVDEESGGKLIVERADKAAGTRFRLVPASDGRWTLAGLDGSAVRCDAEHGGQLLLARGSGSAQAQDDDAGFEILWAGNSAVTWVEAQAALTDPGGLGELCVLVRRAQGASGRLLLDWLEFLPGGR